MAKHPPRVTVTCLNCGTEKLEKPSRAARFSYCTPECMGEHRRKTGSFRGENNPRFVGGPITITCLQCGSEKSFKRNGIPEVDDNHKYCSVDCKVDYERENGLNAGANNGRYKPLTPNVTCIQCQKTRRVVPARVKTFKFCDNKCRTAWRAIHWVGENHPRWNPDFVREKVCEVCEKTFHPRETNITNFQSIRFCSPECGWEGQHYNSGPDHPLFKHGIRQRRQADPLYDKWQSAVFARDAGRCQAHVVGLPACDHSIANGARMHAHHIKEYLTHPDLRYEIDNGLTLCSPCHYRHHHPNLVCEGVTEEVRQGEKDRVPVLYRRVERPCACGCGQMINRRASDTKGKGRLFFSTTCAARGRRNLPGKRLTAGEKRAIWATIQTGVGLSEAARQHGVSPATAMRIRDIFQGRPPGPDQQNKLPL